MRKEEESMENQVDLFHYENNIIKIDFIIPQK